MEPRTEQASSPAVSARTPSANTLSGPAGEGVAPQPRRAATATSSGQHSAHNSATDDIKAEQDSMDEDTLRHKTPAAAVATPSSQQHKEQPPHLHGSRPAKLPTPPPFPSKHDDASSGSSNNSSDIAASDSTASASSLAVENNPDYIALTSALSLLLNQRKVACNDLVHLKKLKTNALNDPERFLSDLRRTGRLPNVPKMQRIVRAPVVSWKSYGIENVHLDHQIARGLVDKTPVLTPIRLFDDKN